MKSRFLDDIPAPEEQTPVPPVPPKPEPKRDKRKKGTMLATTLRVDPIVLARVKLFLEMSLGSQFRGPAEIAREAFNLIEELAAQRFPEIANQIPDVSSALHELGTTISLTGRNRSAVVSALQRELEERSADNGESLAEKARALTNTIKQEIP